MKKIKLFEEFVNEAYENQMLFEAKAPSVFKINFPNSTPASRKYNQSIYDWLDKNANSLGNPEADKEFTNLVKSGLSNADAATGNILDPHSLGGLNLPAKLETRSFLQQLHDNITKNTIIDSLEFGRLSLHKFVVKMRALARKNEEEAGKVYYDEIKNIIDRGYPYKAAAKIDGMLRYDGIKPSMYNISKELIRPTAPELDKALDKLYQTDKHSKHFNR